MSKKGTVRLAYEESGEAAAVASGEKLSIRASKVRRWIKLWTGEGITPPTAEPERGIKRIRPGSSSGGGNGLVEGKMVCLTWDTARRGKLLKIGKDQSEVKFPNGNLRYISTDKLLPVKD